MAKIADFRKDFEKRLYHICPWIRQLYYCMPREIYEKNKEEIDQKLTAYNAGLLLAHHDEEQLVFHVYMGKKANLRKVEKVPDKVLLELLKLAALKWYTK